MPSTPADSPPAETESTESSDRTDGAAAAVTWDFSTDADPVSGALVLCAVGLLAGILVGPLLAVVAIAVVAAVSGELLLLAMLLVAVVAGLALNRAEVAAMRIADHGDLGHGYGRRGLALALLGGGTAHVVVNVLTGEVWLSGVLFAVGIGLLLVAGVLVGEGEVDPDAGAIEYDGDDLPLDSIRSIHPIEFGDRVVVFVRYHGGVPTASRLPTFSAAAFDAAKPLLRAGERATDEDAEDGLPRAVRVTAAAMGVGTLALAGVVYVLAPPDVRPVVGVLAVTTLPVTVVLCWYAYSG
ncbi:hypothetical protein [Halobaculum limi]|uniref:hypothetical protein n=1 Tax=Halobaculum limi TaxID=3031916 RepID=UPI0024055D75|nr:hypothetical protein [Halobaculum sp. YSMS11]